MSPNPAPRPVATLGCFILFAFALISIVVLGASLNDVALIVILSLIFVALILVLVRIVFRSKAPPPSTGSE